jgi:hypothetical protein
MPKLDLDEELVKVTLRLRKSDNDFVMEMAAATRGDVSYNSIMREIVHDYVTRLRAQERALRDARTSEREAKPGTLDMEIAL